MLDPEVVVVEGAGFPHASFLCLVCPFWDFEEIDSGGGREGCSQQVMRRENETKEDGERGRSFDWSSGLMRERELERVDGGAGLPLIVYLKIFNLYIFL